MLNLGFYSTDSKKSTQNGQRRKSRSSQIKKPIRVLALTLTAAVMISVCPIDAFAAAVSMIPEDVGFSLTEETPDSKAAFDMETESSPTSTPTSSPTGSPSSSPTSSPTGTPTGTPTGSPTGTPTGTPTSAPLRAPQRAPSSAQLDALKLAAQDAIDALPDTTAEGFAVTMDNVEELKAALTEASDAIAAYIAAGGDDTLLDTTGFDALSAAVSDSFLSEPAAMDLYYTIEDDFPWFNVDSIIAAGITDSNFAEKVYDSIVAAGADGFEAVSRVDWFVMDSEGYDDIAAYLDGGGASLPDSEKTKYLLNRFMGRIDASNRYEDDEKKIRSIAGILLLCDSTEIDLSYNKIESLVPVAAANDDDPGFSGNVKLQYNPIHVFPSRIKDNASSHTYTYSTHISTYSDLLRYHFGDVALADITMDVQNANGVPYIWEVGTARPEGVLTSADQTEVDALKIGVDTISGGCTGLYLTTGQGMGDNVIGRYYSARQFDDESGTFLPEVDCVVQQNTISFDYYVAVQLYAGVKQDATVETLGSFTFTKTNADGTKNLPGAVYELKTASGTPVTTHYQVDADGKVALDSDGNAVSLSLADADLTTAADGTITITGLPAGSYTLTEKTAPAGYAVNTTPIPFTITAADTATQMAGGIASFNRSADGISVVPDWQEYYIGTNSACVHSTTTDAPVTKTASDYGCDLLITNKKGGGFKTDGAYSSSLQAADYNQISSMSAQIAASEAADYVENSNVSIVMQNPKTGAKPTTLTKTSLADAKSAINSWMSGSKVTGDIAVTSKTYYVAKNAVAVQDNTDTEGASLPLSQTNTLLPVYVQIDAAKSFPGGSEAKTFSFTLSGTAETAVDDTKTCSASNTADGYVIFDALKFTKPGTYTLTLKEDVPTGTDSTTGYCAADGISYDIATHTITITVEENASLWTDEKVGALTAGVSIDGADAVQISSQTTTNTDGTLKSQSAVTGGVFTQGTAGVTAAVFTNSMHFVQMTVKAVKSLKNSAGAAGTLHDGDFSFSLSQESGPATVLGAPVTAACAADGSIDFSATVLNFTAAGNYCFKVTETADNRANPTPLSYDTTARYVMICVTEDTLTKALSAKAYLCEKSGTEYTWAQADAISGTVADKQRGTAQISASKAFENTELATSYAMAKFRVGNAGEFEETGCYGYLPAETVNYKVAVVNTGALALTMDVDDAFATADAANFTDVKFVSAAVYQAKPFTATANATLAQLTALSGAVAEGATTAKVNSGLNTAEVNVTVQPGYTVVFEVTAKVADDAAYSLDDTAADDAANAKTNTHGYTNTAHTDSVEYSFTVITATGSETKTGTLGSQSDTAQTPVRPAVGYAMAKFRVGDAPECGDTGSYGYKPGDTASYRVAVVNTGTLTLTMDVDDAFAEAEAANFTDLKYVSAEVFKAQPFTATASATLAQLTALSGAVAEGAATAKVNSGLNTAKVNVTIQPGYTVVFTVTAKVAADAAASLDNTAADDAANAKTNTHGYPNTANATSVTGSYTAPDGSTKEVTKDTSTELADQSDTAQTPVQPTPAYVMAKFRVGDTPEFESTGTYGYKPGDTATYKIAVVNTGDIALTMDVGDAFATADAANFTDLAFVSAAVYKGVAFDTTASATLSSITPATGVMGFLRGVLSPGALHTAAEGSTTAKVNSGLDTASVNVTIQPGYTVVFTVTAKIAADAAASLDDTASDDDANPKTNTHGYTNTAAVENVTGSIALPDGTDGSVTVTDYPALADQTDTAQTPVQPELGYAMAKFRVGDAPEFGNSGYYGYKPGDTTSYRVAVVNTGSLALTMDVDDAYAAADAANFTDLKYVSAEVFKAQPFTATADATLAQLTALSGAVAESATTAKVNSGLNTASVNVTIQPGYTVVFTVTETVADDALYRLDDTAADDAANAKTNTHGYTNTANATSVKGSYTAPDGSTVEATKDMSEKLADQSDTAQTPIQPKPAYALAKFRVGDAPECGNTGTYGYKPGETATYHVALVNTGDLPLTMNLKDVFGADGIPNFEGNAFQSAQFFAGTPFTDTASAALSQLNALGTPQAAGADTGTINSDFGTDEINVTLQPGHTVVLELTADVAPFAVYSLDDTAADDATNDKSNEHGYISTVTAEDVEADYQKPDETDGSVTETDFDELASQTDYTHTPVQPTPSYAMAKFRVGDAGKFEETGSYGYLPGETADYKVAVVNTGNLPLTMKVSDAFAAAGAANFTDVKFVSAEVFKAQPFTANADAKLSQLTALSGAVAESDTTAKVNSGLNTAEATITIQPGYTVVFDASAKAAEDAAYSLDDTAADDAENAKTNTHGYTSTADTKQVQGTISLPSGTEITADQTGFPALAPQADTTQTPIRPTAGYTMKKVRITEAPGADGTSDKYGFREGDKVTYQISVENTGTMDLEMDVTDTFSESTFFEQPIFESAEVDGEPVNGNPLPNSDKVHISVPAGKTCLITVTTVVKNGTPRNVAPSSSDDKTKPNDGYVSTVSASDVKATYTAPDGTVQPLDSTNAPDALGSWTDTVNTPVQVKLPPPTPAETSLYAPVSAILQSVKTGDDSAVMVFACMAVLGFAALWMVTSEQQKKRRRVRRGR